MDIVQHGEEAYASGEGAILVEPEADGELLVADPGMTEYVQVLTTVSSEEDAKRIADDLLDRRLAACVQVVGPIASRYRWQGALEQAQEWQCLVKTEADLYKPGRGGDPRDPHATTSPRSSRRRSSPAAPAIWPGSARASDDLELAHQAVVLVVEHVAVDDELLRCSRRSGRRAGMRSPG